MHFIVLQLCVSVSFSFIVPMLSRDQANFSILSWNVLGLNSKFKRALLFRYLKTHSPHMVLLQEKHLMGSKLLMLKRPWVQKTFHASYSTFSRGVPILISKSLPCIIEHVYSAPQGKYVLAVFLLWGQRYIVVNVYIPLPFSGALLYSLLKRITPSLSSQIIICGRF